MSSAAVGNLVFFAAGADAGLSFVTDVVDIYDTTSQTWSTSHLTQGRAWGAATSIGDLFMIGGGINETFTPLNSVEIYSIITATSFPSNVKSLAIFPNPVGDNLNLINSLHQGSLEISNSLGQVVLRKTLSENPGLLSVSVDFLSQGIYTIEIRDGEKRVFRKFVKS